MKVNQVNLGYNKAYNAISFARKNNDCTTVDKFGHSMSKVYIPAALFIAMIPSVSNAQVETSLPAAETQIYSTSRQPEYLRSEYIQDKKDFKYRGENYTMIYTDYGKKFTSRSNQVADIYFVPENFKFIYSGYETLNRPPKLEQLVKHNTEDGDYFIGAIVSEMVCDKDGSNFRYIEREMVLPDKIGNALLKLYKGETKFQPVSGLSSKYTETDSSDLFETRIQSGKKILTL